ncbi:MAG: SCO family protein [Pseudomonadota bacterium]|nr:SCO family protein [Pseudomonadota bacterium]
MGVHPRRSAVPALVLALALAPPLSLRPAQAAPASAYRMDLSFVDDHGSRRALSEWRGRPVVIAMAYGACRSVCSTTLRTLEELQALADREGASLDVVVVSIDPAEDTPQAWSDYRAARRLQRTNWTFLSGDKDATRTLARFLGVTFWSYDEHVLHNLRIVRLGPDGEPGAALDWNHRKVESLLR